MSRSVLALLSALVLLLAGCGDGADVEVDDVDDVDAGDTEAAEPDPDDGETDEAEDAEATDDGATHDEASSPQPDPDEVAAPCSERDEQATDAFVDVVAPVDGQRVHDELELVGCASVYEGTVRFRLVTDEGEELVDDFTTAECGGPCVGEFAVTIDLATAEGHEAATLEVFWDSPADGEGERDMQEIELVLGEDS